MTVESAHWPDPASSAPGLAGGNAAELNTKEIPPLVLWYLRFLLAFIHLFFNLSGLFQAMEQSLKLEEPRAYPELLPVAALSWLVPSIASKFMEP